MTFSYKMPSGSGQVSPVDSLDGDNEERDQQTGKINIINSTLLSQLTSNSPLPVYKPAPSYRLVSHYMGQWLSGDLKFGMRNIVIYHFNTHHFICRTIIWMLRPLHTTTEPTNQIIHRHYDLYSQLQQFFQQFYIWATIFSFSCIMQGSLVV